MQVAAVQVSTPLGTPLGPLNAAANNMSLILQNLEVDLNNIKSPNNFTT